MGLRIIDSAHCGSCVLIIIFIHRTQGKTIYVIVYGVIIIIYIKIHVAKHLIHFNVRINSLIPVILN